MLAKSVSYSCETSIKAVNSHNNLATPCTRLLARFALSLSRSVHGARKLWWLLRARFRPRRVYPLTTASMLLLCSLHYHYPQCSQRRLTKCAPSMLWACSQYRRRVKFLLSIQGYVSGGGTVERKLNWTVSH
jgi:hypothetical protein